MADDPSELVNIQLPATFEVREVPRAALPYFVNQGYRVLDARGRVNAAATSAANKEK